MAIQTLGLHTRTSVTARQFWAHIQETWVWTKSVYCLGVAKHPQQSMTFNKQWSDVFASHMLLLCAQAHLSGQLALRVFPAETRLTVYRRMHIHMYDRATFDHWFLEIPLSDHGAPWCPSRYGTYLASCKGAWQVIYSTRSWWQKRFSIWHQIIRKCHIFFIFCIASLLYGATQR